MTLFLEIFDEDSLFHGFGKATEEAEDLLSSGHLISDEDWPVGFHITLAITRDLSRSIRVEM
jgi:hypothetical protein